VKKFPSRAKRGRQREIDYEDPARENQLTQESRNDE